MPINNIKLRYIVAMLIGLLLAIFGVFLFSDFEYRGIRLVDDIFPSFQAGSFNTFWAGIYQLVGSGFSANIFAEFSLTNIQAETLFGVIFGETFWGAFIAWFTTGFVVGVVVKGGKHGLIAGLLLFLGICIIYFIAAMFAGSNIGGGNFLATIGEILTGLGTIILSSWFGGFLSGPH